MAWWCVWNATEYIYPSETFRCDVPLNTVYLALGNVNQAKTDDATDGATFTHNSDQMYQISPSASPEILHHTKWRTWLFIAYSDENHNTYVYQFSVSIFNMFLLNSFAPKLKKYILPTFYRENVFYVVVNIGSTIICHLSTKLWKAKFFMLSDVIFLVRQQGKFEIDYSWERKG